MTTPPTENIRPLRHRIRYLTYHAARLTSGAPGLSKGDQMIVLDKQIELLEQALEAAKQARKIVAERDFDAHQVEKAKPAYDTLPTGETVNAEKAAFQQIIGMLNQDAPTAPDPQEKLLHEDEDQDEDGNPLPPL